MRILLFPQSLGLGGVERLTSHLAHGLARRGHYVAVAALHTIAAGWEEILDPNALPLTIFFPRTPGSALEAADQLISATRKLRRLLQAEKIDCIYCTAGPVPPVVGWLAARTLTSVRVVWSLQLAPTRAWAHENRHSRLLRQFSVGVSRSVPLLISCSDDVQKSAQVVGYRCKRQVVIYNGVNPARFRPDPAARTAIRAEWGVSPDKRLVGLVARLDPVKGHPVFLEAARIMAGERDDLLFVCVGDGPGPYRSHLHRLGTDLGLSERLIWTGARSFGELPAVYNALDVLCLSSYNEGFPLALLEAMACGIPCVATRAAGVRESIGDVGITVPLGDPPALAHGVLTALLAEPRPGVLRRYVVEHFSDEAMIAATEREIATLVGCEASE
jgi:glycosyltransferase involved in cell wall biosynthesis